ncbi:MAG: guanylate kinase [Candidatus Humimicrobiaceae bacterium]
MTDKINQQQNDKNGTLFVISGPSGAGKSSLVREALAKVGNLVKSVSATTRPPRKGEVHGKNYYFVNKDEFEKMIEKDELLEWADYCGYYYGTPLKYVNDNLKKGINIILEIEVIGAMKVKKIIPDAYLIFVTVFNIMQLEKRLRKRATECDEDITTRIKKAKEEMKSEKYYDCIIINNNYNEALKNLIHVLTSKSGGNL